LWAFEESIDESILLADASSKEFGESARAVLSTLWQHDRLSAKSKRAIVEKSLTLRLEEDLNRPADGSRELRIIGVPSFPFPKHSWVEWRYNIVIGEDRKPVLEGDSWNSSSLEESAPQMLGSLGAGGYFGSPKARALFEMREVRQIPIEEPYWLRALNSTTPDLDVAIRSTRRVVWSHRWELGPIQLRQANPR
jgi:hypothetical protein